MVYINRPQNSVHGHKKGWKTWKNYHLPTKLKNQLKKKTCWGSCFGDLEVLVNPIDHDETTVSVITGSDGFAPVWENVLNRFFERYPIQAAIEINDFGATPVWCF